MEPAKNLLTRLKRSTNSTKTDWESKADKMGFEEKRKEAFEEENKQDEAEVTAFNKFAETTSLHGVGRIVETKTQVGKISWGVLLVGFLIFLSIMLFNVFTSYMSNNIYIVREKIQVEKMVFPSISFCPTALLRKSGLSKQSMLIPMVFHMYQGKEHMVDVNKLRIANLLSHEDLHKGFKGIKNVTPDADTLFMKKMFSGCRFGLDTPCYYPREFQETPVSLFEGVCFKFNPTGNFTQMGEGSYYGLSIILFVNQSDTDSFSGFDVGSGMKLVIQSHETFPFPLENGILVSPGYYTRIILQKQAYKRLPPPYPSRCRSSGKTIYPGSYTPRNCKRSCFVRYAKKACNGTDAFVEFYSGEKRNPPLNKTELMCFYDKQIEAAWPQNAKNCDCPLQCYEETYFPMVTHSLWPSPADLPYYKKIFASSLGMNPTTMTDDYVYKNFIKLNIFFSELAYEKVTEMPEWTGQKLISDIGGQMGIWIGASLFSVLELIIFLFYMAKTRVEVWYYRPKKNDVQAMPTCVNMIDVKTAPDADNKVFEMQ